jgi:hypothetical protein
VLPEAGLADPGLCAPPGPALGQLVPPVAAALPGVSGVAWPRPDRRHCEKIDITPLDPLLTWSSAGALLAAVSWPCESSGSAQGLPDSGCRSEPLCSSCISTTFASASLDSRGHCS